MPDLGIVTIAVSLPSAPNRAAACGLIKWCWQAHALARSLATVWTAEVSILAPSREPSLEDCREARVLPWDYVLARKLRAYSRLPFVANVSFEREYVADWLALNMQKIQLLSSAVAPYRAVYFTDWDVDPAPSIPHAASACSSLDGHLLT